jgi:hypothetical protein
LKIRRQFHSLLHHEDEALSKEWQVAHSAILVPLNDSEADLCPIHRKLYRDEWASQNRKSSREKRNPQRQLRKLFPVQVALVYLVGSVPRED